MERKCIILIEPFGIETSEKEHPVQAHLNFNRTIWN